MKTKEFLYEINAGAVWKFVSDNVARIKYSLARKDKLKNKTKLLDIPGPHEDLAWEEISYLVKMYTKSSKPETSNKIKKILLKRLNGNETARDFLLSERGQRELAELLSN